MVRRMINLKAFIDSMKLTWLRRVILSSSPWQSVMNNTINFNELLVFGRIYTNAIQNKIKNNFGLMYYMHTQIFPNLLVKTLNILFFQVQYSITVRLWLATNQYIYKKWGQQEIKNINDLIHVNGELLFTGWIWTYLWYKNLFCSIFRIKAGNNGICKNIQYNKFL